MYPSPIKSKGLSPLKASRRRSPSRQNTPENAACIRETLVHPILDGTNLTRRQTLINDQARQRQQPWQNGSSKLMWNPSDSEFIEPNPRKKRNHLFEETIHEATENSIDNSSNLQIIGTHQSTGSAIQSISKNTTARPQNENETDDDVDNSTSEVNATIPTLDTYQPRTPSYTKANSLPFHTICQRLDKLWEQRRITGRKAVSKSEKLKYLLPDSLMKYLEGGSPYPFLRLICPDHDSSRSHTGLKEAMIAKVWGDAMGLMSNSRGYKKLTHYRDPEYNGKYAGDLSVVVHQLTIERYGSGSGGKIGSKLTVGEVNDWLDVLVDIVKDRFDLATSESGESCSSAWRVSLEKVVRENGQVGKKTKKHDKYVRLLEKLISKNLSPIEHKWIVRILLQKMEIGFNFNSILDYYNPHAMKLYSAFNNMKELCKRLSDPKYVTLLKMTHEQNAKDIVNQNREIWRPQSQIPPEIQKTISPMLSHRTSFDSYLKEVAHRHHELDKVLPVNSPAKSSLALIHPAIACEIKMDGERMLVHVKRGIVTMHTRRNVWYSPLYSPAVGPAIRAAISKYDVDVILDGEILAWDAHENKAVPFGTNRAVAEMRRNQRAADGTLDERDCNLHKDARDANVMSLAKEKSFKHLDSAGINQMKETTSSDQYWLKYVVFDIIYVDGPDAKKLISKSNELFPQNEPIITGSIMNLDLMRRKSILYNLISPQLHEVEPIQSVIIRSDGTSMDAKDYFTGGKREYGKSTCAMDSIVLAMCEDAKTTIFDLQRLGGKSHDDIEVLRSLALEQCYRQIVENSKQEGLLLKDLSSPYYLGAASRRLRYWYKLKPDYNASGQASDIDVLVLGGKYAQGFRQAGLLSALLVGIIDDRMGVQGNVKYLTLCMVNFNRDIEQLMQATGFQKADGVKPLRLGKWFDASDDSVPEFISEWSFQRNPQGDNDGWKPKKKDRPDLYINPEDSFVLTLNSAEIIASDSFSAGLCLRFPRITSIRAEGFDKGPKPHDEVQTFTELSTLFVENEDDDVDPMELESGANVQSSRFLTAKQLEKSGKQKKSTKSRKQTAEVKTFHIPDVDNILSRALDGLTFTVLPGNYRLENDSFAAAEAVEYGWAGEARSVSSREDVVRFIKSHGGKCELSSHVGSDFILGGSIDDPKVAIYNDLISATNEDDIMITTTKRDAQTRRFFEMGGITKWTFPFSVVSKYLKSAAANNQESIKQIMPTLIRPRRSDYLLMTKSAATSLNDTEDEYGLRTDDSSNMIDFQRALEIVGSQNSTKKQRQSPRVAGVSPTWQSIANTTFAESDRWVFGCKLQKLWPKDSSDSRCQLIVYPDVFVDLGFEEESDAVNEGDSGRWKNSVAGGKRQGSALAVLPLLQVMGATVTTHLHHGVTHILCELRSKKILKWTSVLPRSVFADSKSGSVLHERLFSLEESATIGGRDGINVMLVSPEWVEEQWNE